MYSIHVEIEKTIPNTFNLKVDGLVVYLKIGEKAAANLIIPLGLYTLKELETKFPTGIDLKLSIENERVMLTIPDNYKVVISHNIINMLGILNIKHDEWIGKKNNYSKPFKSVERLKIYCKQLEKSNHLINGVYTNCLCVIPLITNQTVIQYTPTNLIYLPIEYPTRNVDFKIIDQNGTDVPIKR